MEEIVHESVAMMTVVMLFFDDHSLQKSLFNHFFQSLLVEQPEDSIPVLVVDKQVEPQEHKPAVPQGHQCRRHLRDHGDGRDLRINIS